MLRYLLLWVRSSQKLRRSVGYCSGLVVGLSCWGMAIPAWAALELRVAIEENVGQVNVGSSTKAVVKDANGKPLGEIAAMNAFVAQLKDGQVQLDRWQAPQVWIEPVDGGYVYIGDRWYRGRTAVVPTSSGLTAVNYVDLEQYLYSVLGGEMGGGWPQEALKAQAVAARSYALYQRQRGSNGVYDLGDTPAWQMYGGIADESTGTQAAVNATSGQVLTYKGEIIEAVFHSSAGGCTENVEEVWSEPLPYLRSVRETLPEQSPVAQWSKTLSRSEMSHLITGVGNVTSIQVKKRTSTCGRIVALDVEGDAGRREIKGDDLQAALDLKSTFFEIEPQYGPAEVPASPEPTRNPTEKAKAASGPSGFQITGRGFGHGLGLSQYGARQLALSGMNYQQIMSFYYKDTTLAKIQVK